MSLERSSRELHLYKREIKTCLITNVFICLFADRTITLILVTASGGKRLMNLTPAYDICGRQGCSAFMDPSRFPFSWFYDSSALEQPDCFSYRVLRKDSGVLEHA